MPQAALKASMNSTTPTTRQRSHGDQPSSLRAKSARYLTTKFTQSPIIPGFQQHTSARCPGQLALKPLTDSSAGSKRDTTKTGLVGSAMLLVKFAKVS